MKSTKWLGVLSAIASAWMAAGYLLPRTIWGRIAAPRLFSMGVPEDFCLYFGIVICVGSWAAYRRDAATTRSLARLWVLIAIYIGAFIAEGIWLQATGGDASRCVLILIPIGTGLLAARLCNTPTRAAQVLTILVAMQSYYAIRYLLHGVGILWSGDIPRAGGTYGKPTAVYTMALICLPFAMSLAFQDRPKAARWVWAVCALIMLAALVTTWYRFPILALALAGGWLSFRLIGKRTLTFAIQLILVLLVLLSWHIRSEGVANQISSERSELSHSICWRLGLQTFHNHLFTGVGPAQLQIIVHSQATNAVYHLQEPKNLLIMWLAEFGISGGVLMALFVVVLVKVMKQGRSIMTDAIAVSWIAVAVAGISDTPIGVSDRPYSNLLLGVLLGMSLLVNNTEDKHDTESKKPAPSGLLYEISSTSEPTMLPERV